MGKVTSKIFDLRGEKVGKVRLPQVFKTPLRRDLIKRTVVAIQSHRFQPQGRNKMAGKRTTAESMGVGLGISRVPRVGGGGRRAAFAPGTVGGRVAHPPSSRKKIGKKVPKKEKRLALKSAIAATSLKDIVSSRGHLVEDIPDFPLIITNDIQKLEKTKEVENVLLHLGVLSDIYRVKDSRKVRAGKGKMRGRKMKQAVGPLLVVSETQGIEKGARNIPGLTVTAVKDLNVELLAPGAHPGRLTIWAQSAIETVETLFGGK